MSVSKIFTTKFNLKIGVRQVGNSKKAGMEKRTNEIINGLIVDGMLVWIGANRVH